MALVPSAALAKRGALGFSVEKKQLNGFLFFFGVFVVFNIISH